MGFNKEEFERELAVLHDRIDRLGEVVASRPGPGEDLAAKSTVYGQHREILRLEAINKTPTTNNARLQADNTRMRGQLGDIVHIIREEGPR